MHTLEEVSGLTFPGAPEAVRLKYAHISARYARRVEAEAESGGLDTWVVSVPDKPAPGAAPVPRLFVVTGWASGTVCVSAAGTTDFDRALAAPAPATTYHFALPGTAPAVLNRLVAAVARWLVEGAYPPDPSGHDVQTVDLFERDLKRLAESAAKEGQP